MHGEGNFYSEETGLSYGCGGYFCHDHKHIVLCNKCQAELDADEEKLEDGGDLHVSTLPKSDGDPVAAG